VTIHWRRDNCEFLNQSSTIFDATIVGYENGAGFSGGYSLSKVTELLKWEKK
jgi:hypothetical protein